MGMYFHKCHDTYRYAILREQVDTSIGVGGVIVNAVDGRPAWWNITYNERIKRAMS